MDGEFLEIIFELTEIEHCNVIIMICQTKIHLCYSKFLILNLLDPPPQYALESYEGEYAKITCK
jgi:hypothetical protein